MLTLEQIKDKKDFILSNSVIQETGCIEYKILNKDGYGHLQFWLNGIKHHLLAHRAWYMIKNNTILTTDQIILHTCDNPACINIEHLLLGNHNDNVQDKVRKNRQAKGELNGRSKLTKDKVLLIRSSDLSNSKLANEFNVDKKTIRLIKSNKIWKDC